MCPELPLHLYSAAATRQLDAQIIAAGTPGLELMQRAAAALWRELRRRWPDANRLTVLCGSGNNAGDGYLVTFPQEENVQALIDDYKGRLQDLENNIWQH